MCCSAGCSIRSPASPPGLPIWRAGTTGCGSPARGRPSSPPSPIASTPWRKPSTRRERARQHPDVSFAFSAAMLPPSYGDSIDLTVYRCVQEGLTNVIGHAAATRVEIDLTEAEGALRLVVRDDGCGFDPAVPAGRGL